VVERRVVADARRIVELAGDGLPVTSNNARLLVQYLDEFESQNLALLAATQVSHKMGWQGDNGKDGFLWGRTLITAEAMMSEDSEASSSENGHLIRFRGTDEGDDQLADGFRTAGRFSAWVRGIRPLEPYPRARLALYASFVPAMLPILKTPNFVVDFSGPTTAGKTTCLRAAASVWGNPDERSQAAVLSTWNGTVTWRERAPAVLTNLPFILDETKHVRHPEEVAKTIYGVVQGRGRGRGTVQGIAHQDFCQTVLLSSGEQPATSFTHDGGTRPRVLTIWGSPFGATSQLIGKKVKHINTWLREHHGHAGPRFVQYLLQHRKHWGKARDWYDELVRHYEEMAGDNTVAGRMAAHLAAITVTSKLVHDALHLPWAWSDPIEPLWAELTQESGEADQSAAALRHVLSWAYGHQNDFFGLKEEREQPHAGWAGRWDKGKDDSINPNTSAKDEPADLNSTEVESQDGGHKTGGNVTKGWEWVGFMPHVLEKLLREANYDPNSIIRTWKDKEWLKTDAASNGTMRNQYRAKIGRGTVRVYAITREAAEGVMVL
jgi:hypothetical protein